MERDGLAKPKTSTRDPDDLRAALTSWLQAKVGATTPPNVELLGGPRTSGMSSETLPADLSWNEHGRRRTGRVVVRLPPAPDAWPVFPTYDLDRQAFVMEWLGQHSTVPVPKVWWYEPDPSALSAPFLVMERVDGVVAPDVMPYTFDSWVTRLSDDEQRRVADAAIDVLGDIHHVDPTPDVVRALELEQHHGTPLRRHVDHHIAHYEWAREGRTFPTIERAFAVLEARWPAEEPPARISWGDARLGNIIWSGTDPVAVLDWESAALAPPEVDVAWMAFFGEFFQRSAERRGLRGVPGFIDRHSVVRRYEARTGRRVHAFEWYLLYAAVRQAVVSIRTMARAVHFGDVPPPSTPEGLVLDLPFLAELIDELGAT